MTKCSTCLKEKPENEFYHRRTGKRKGQNYKKCKECFKERGRKYWLDNWERQYKLAKIRNKKYILERKAIIMIAKDKPCTDCKVKFDPWIMEFDHRDPNKKLIV